MKSMRFWMVLILLVFMVAACSSAEEPVAPEEGTLAPQGIVAEGRLQPAATVDLAFTTAGRVAEILVEEGDPVEAGQVIARLEVVNPEIRQLELARAEQENFNAQLALEVLQESVKIASLQAQVAVLDLELQISATQDNLQAEQDKEEPDPQLIAWYEATLEMLAQKLADGEALSASLAAGPDPDQVAAAELRLATSEAALVSAGAGLRPVELVAPWAGVLTTINLRLGQVAAAGVPAATLADTTAWVVKTDNLTEIEVVGVKVGQAVTLVFDALPGQEVKGKVTGIRSQFEEKRGDVTYTVTINPDTLPAETRWGMTAVIIFEK